MSQFRAAAAVMAAALDEHFGELVLVEPYVTKPNMPATRDTAKPAARCAAVFSHKSQLAFPSTQSTRAVSGGEIETGVLIQTRKPCFSFSYGATPWPIHRGYHITRLCDGTEWEVTAVKPDGVSRIEIEAVQLGRAKDY